MIVVVRIAALADKDGGLWIINRSENSGVPRGVSANLIGPEDLFQYRK